MGVKNVKLQYKLMKFLVPEQEIVASRWQNYKEPSVWLNWHCNTPFVYC